jgi:hypothetical protein
MDRTGRNSAWIYGGYTLDWPLDRTLKILCLIWNDRA